MTPKEKLDTIFSLYIRHRDCPDGLGRCISCGAIVTPKECDAGHFIPRAHISTRWDECNVNVQCMDCNRMQDGNMAGYTIGIVERWGDGIIEELKALKWQTVKMGPSDYERLIKKYKNMTTI